MKRALVLSFFVLGACGGKAAATPAGVDSEPAKEPDPSVVKADVASTPEPPKRQRKPFEVLNSCSDVVTVVFAEDPKAPSAGKRTIAPSGTIEGPRDDAGNQTVWLLDATGESLVKVHVTRGMKRVEVGKSCRTLDAR